MDFCPATQRFAVPQRLHPPQLFRLPGRPNPTEQPTTGAAPDSTKSMNHHRNQQTPMMPYNKSKHPNYANASNRSSIPYQSALKSDSDNRS